MSEGDNKPFNIQGHYGIDNWHDNNVHKCTVPWWLAEIAYEYYAEQYGRQQSLERLHERGGFSRGELVSLIRRDRP